MQDHLGLKALERLVHRSCDVSLAYGWLLHLLGCEDCRSSLVNAFPGKGTRFLREVFDTQRPVELPELRDPVQVDRILDHLKRCGLASFLERPTAPASLLVLQSHPPERQRLLVRNCSRFHSLETVRQLLDRSRWLRHEDAREGLNVAELALVALDRLSAEEYHPRLLEDVRGTAWGMVGNAQRILTRLDDAERSLRRAQHHLEQGTGDALELAELYNVLASLRKDQERLQEAQGLTERSGRLFLQLGERRRAAGALTKRVILLSMGGRFEEARRAGEDLLDEFTVDELGLVTHLAIRQNVALAMAKAGWTLPALRHLREIRRQAAEASLGRLCRLRLDWSEAQVRELTGLLDEAETWYCELREAFTDAGIRVDAAMLSLDLARVYRKQRKRRRARRAARRAVPHLHAARLHHLAVEARQILSGA
jgi:tetratricopeptide (TPR) repeat protein